MKPEVINYYDIKRDSSSSLKTFSEDRKKYYKKFISGEKVEEKYNQSILIGNLVDCILLTPEEFDDRFYMSTCQSVPTGLMLAFVEALYQCSVHMEKSSFEQISKAAYEMSGFKIGYEAVLKKFVGSNAEDYFNEIINARTKNLIVVTIEDMTNAERVINELKSNFVTSHIINLDSDDRFTVINQFQISDFELNGLKLKAMMDKVIIDNQDKTIQIYDLKCTWDVENFFAEYYLYRKSYIQSFLYYSAWSQIVLDENSLYYGYTVLFPKFIVSDSINYMNPLIYELNAQDIEDSYNGFEYKGKWYDGVKDIIEDLKFALDNNIWNISRSNYESKGIVNLR